MDHGDAFKWRHIDCPGNQTIVLRPPRSHATSVCNRYLRSTATESGCLLSLLCYNILSGYFQSSSGIYFSHYFHLFVFAFPLAAIFHTTYSTWALARVKKADSTNRWWSAVPGQKDHRWDDNADNSCKPTLPIVGIFFQSEHTRPWIRMPCWQDRWGVIETYLINS